MGFFLSTRGAFVSPSEYFCAAILWLIEDTCLLSISYLILDTCQGGIARSDIRFDRRGWRGKKKVDTFNMDCVPKL